MSISTALKARREQLRDREAGFTLIELLVVVIIIGILAAIAIPVYIGVQNSAKDTAATSDLANAKIAVTAQYSATGNWVALSTASANATAFGNYGWTTPSDATKGAVDASSTAGGSSTAWCIKELSQSSAATPFYVTQSTAPTSTKPSGCA